MREPLANDRRKRFQLAPVKATKKTATKKATVKKTAAKPRKATK